MGTKTGDFIDVADLRIGHYIHLDIGWMGHPFALNSFRISSADQIETIKTLGLKQIRYVPEQSVVPQTDVVVPFSLETVATTEQAANATEFTPVVEDTELIRVAVERAANSAAETTRKLHREHLSLQRANQQLCENHFNETARAYKHIVDLMHGNPTEAKISCDQVVDSMIEQMGDQSQETLVRLLAERSGERTSLHSINVSIVSLLLGKAMACTPDQLRDIGIGALLHDLGKMDIPDRLRWSESELSNAEKSIYRGHVAKGVTTAKRMNLSVGAQLIIAQHHEFANGAGYPQGLKDDQITLPARIVSLVNHYDNLCSPSNPAVTVTPHEALSMLYAQHRNNFDSRAMAVFIRLMGVYPPGSIVELSDGRHAMVVSVNSSRPLRPHVMIHEPEIPANEALVVNLEGCPEIGVRRSIKPIQLPRDAYDYLSPRKRLCYFFESSQSQPLTA